MCYKCDRFQKWICIIEEYKPIFRFTHDTYLYDVYTTVEHQVEWFYVREIGRKYPSLRIKPNKHGVFHGKSVHGADITLNKELDEAFKSALGNYTVEQEILNS